MTPRLLARIVAFTSALTALAASAGTVNVTMRDASRYADAGSTPWEIQANLRTLSSHLVALGQRYLPADEVLNIDILDVDLAGTPTPSAGQATDLRIVRGGADWPRIELHYALETSGQPAQEGRESLSDMSYAQRMRTLDPADPLHYEKRMLDDWFKQRFAANTAR